MSQVQSGKFVRAASTTEVTSGRMKKVDVNGTQVLVANVKGIYCAVNNICPHAGASLAEGNLTDNIVTCARHGALFNVQTGAAVGKAKVFVFRQMPKDVACYEVKIEGTDILVSIDGTEN